MKNTLPPGLYDLLQTPQLKKRLKELGLVDSAVWESVDPTELPKKVVVHLARELSVYLEETVFSKSDSKLWQGALDQAMSSPEFINEFLPSILPESSKTLH